MSARRFLLCAAALAGSLVPGSASAQITTDRPGLGLSSQTVGRGAFQVEAGLPQADRQTFTGLNGTLITRATLTSYSFPVALRYGITRRVELRLSTPAAYRITRVTSNVPNDRGAYGRSLDTVTLGAKIAVPVGGVALALVPEVDVVVQGYSSSSGLRFNAPASFPLGDFEVTLMPGIQAGDNLGLTAVGVVSRAFGALTAYAEAGAFPNADFEGSNPTPIIAGGGVLARLTPSTQLDAFFDAGLNDAAPGVAFGVGLSFRLD